jgi:hypothetical protein
MVVWWSGLDSRYPWQAENTAYPEDRLDNWQPLTVPYSIQNYWG